MKDKIYDWRELNLQSGDILFCEGFGSLSKKIQWFQRLTGAPDDAALISHIAGVRGESSRMEPNSWALESTTINKWAGNKRGVQENPLCQWLYCYAGRIWVRKLDFMRSEGFYFRDDEFFYNHKDDPYESGILGGLELLLCGVRLDRAIRWVWPSYNPLITKDLHCSELIAKRLANHDLWNDKRPPVNKLPPYVWLNIIDKWLTVPISEPIRIK